MLENAAATDEPRRDVDDGSTRASLLHELTAADPHARAWAAVELGGLGDQRAVPALIDVVLYDQDQDVREEAAVALGALRDPCAIPAIFTLLNVPCPPDDPPASVYQALLPMRTAAVAHLLAALLDPDPAVRIAYAHNLVHHCFFLLVREKVKRAGRITPDADTERLIGILLQVGQDPCAEVRAAALDTLAPFDDRRVRPALLAALRDTDAVVRQVAARRLRPLVTAVDELREYLSDPRAATRAAALAVVPHRHDLVIKALTDRKAVVSETALSLLRESYRTRGSVITEDELAQLRDTIPSLVRDANAAVREHALFCLALIGSPDLYQEALAAAQDTAPNVRAAALLILAGYTDDLGFTPHQLVNKLAWDADPFAHLPYPLPAIRDIYARAADDADPTVAIRARVCLWLTIDNVQKRFDHAVSAYHAASAQLRAIVTAYIALVNHPRRLPLLKAALADQNRHVRLEAIWALSRLEGQRAVADLLPALADPSGSVRKAVLSALEEMGDPHAVPAIIPRLRDKHRGVRLKAAATLRALTGEDFGSDIEEWLGWWGRHEG